MNSAPSTKELASRFIIPKKQMQDIAEWMGIKRSTLYAVLSGRSKLRKSYLNIDSEVFDIDLPIDYRRKLLYSSWYDQISIKDLF